MSKLEIGTHVMIDTPFMGYPYNGAKGMIFGRVFDPLNREVYVIKVIGFANPISMVAVYEDHITRIETNPNKKLTAQADINGTNTHTCPCEFDLTKYLSDE